MNKNPRKFRTPKGRVPQDFSHVKKVACAGCGKTPEETLLIRLPGSMVRSWACQACILKFGTDALNAEVDRHFDSAVGLTTLSKPCQRGCGRRVLPEANGKFPLWCSGCQAEYRELMAK